jgi:hypothetical protein
MKRYAAASPFHMAHLVDLADAGWSDADLSLRELIAEVSAHGPLPPVLAAYNIKIINPQGLRAARTRGRKKATNFLADLAIVVVVLMLVEKFGLRPTRFQPAKSRRPSACSIVADVMTDANLHRGGETALQEVWRRLSPLVIRGSTWEPLFQTNPRKRL